MYEYVNNPNYAICGVSYAGSTETITALYSPNSVDYAKNAQ